jgi:hypothetical protein
MSIAFTAIKKANYVQVNANNELVSMCGAKKILAIRYFYNELRKVSEEIQDTLQHIKRIESELPPDDTDQTCVMLILLFLLDYE